jgi:O-antigen ligase
VEARDDEPGRPSAIALVALTGAATLAPWALGGAPPFAQRALLVGSLGALAVALAFGALGRGAALPAVPLWPLGAFAALAAVQAVPMPPAVLAVLAPGPAAVWHPAEPAVAAALGPGPHPISLDPRTTLRGAAFVAALGGLAALAAPRLARGRAATRAAGAVAAGGFAMAAYAIVARARFGARLYGSIEVPTVFPFGPFVNKNHFAGWTAMGALLAAALAVGLAARAQGGGGRDWTTGRDAILVVLATVAAAAMALAVVVSLSRGGALALLSGTLVLGALVLRRGGRRARRSLPGAALAVSLVALVLLAAPEPAHERLRSLGGASFRVDTWGDALRLAGASPLFGSGLGAFHDAFPRFKTGHGELRVEHAECEYVELLAETGLVGLGLAAAGLGLLVRVSVRRARPSSVAAAVGCGGLAALAALAAHSTVDFDLRLPSNAALAALAAAAAASLAGARPRLLSRAACGALALVALVALAAAAREPGAPVAAAAAELRSAAGSPSAAVRALRLARADSALESAIRRRPADAQAWLLLAYTRAARGEGVAAAALARHAETLDPRRPGMREAVGSFATLRP